MYTRLFKGTGSLTKLMMKQERFKIIIWLLAIILVTLATASSYSTAFPDQQSLQGYALTMENPAMKAMIGIGYAMEDMSIATIFAIEMLLFTAIAVAIMNVLITGQCTRGDEEDGRAEVVRSLPVGRLSYLSATMIVMIITNIVLALLTAIGLVALDIESIEGESAFLYGAILGATGLIFAGITALCAQLSQTSGGTKAIAFALLIGSYLVRAIGDTGNETISLFSPLGWTGRTDVFAGNEWLPVMVLAVAAIVTTAAAFYLNSIRDVGTGFLPERKGKKHASPLLKSPFGLALRLQRTNILSWAVGIYVLSVAFGSVLGDMEKYFAHNEFVQAVIALDPSISFTEQFITMLMAIMSLISVIPAVMVILKLKGEEKKNRTEHFYSRAVSRTRVLGSYTILAVMVSFIMQLLIALGLWSAGSAMLEDPLTFGELLSSALAYLPAMWIIIGLALLFVGAVPKVSGLIWLYVTYCFIVLYLKAILEFADWVNNLSSFENIPLLLNEDVDYLPMIVLTLISIILAVIGFVGYNKRDMAG